MTTRERTDVRRLPEKQVRDVAVLHAILDGALQAAVGFQVDGQPFVLPMACAREGDDLLLHGSTGSRLMRTLAAGAPVCVSVTHLDGLVYARSAFESSMRYRSATILGTAVLVPDDEKLHALEVLTEHLLPGRWAELRAPRAKELAATSVLRVALEEWSVKVSDGFPDDPDEDLDEPVWAGVVPMRVSYDDPVDAPDLAPDRPVPPHVRALLDRS
ncbi:pyridoxamine 5'-phosphate oxidase family protein [Nocardioides KLBMP 9356]|uniref:Pyridoxamine 5'-phosphate oxidase family protein n=1 Tax=Nocardioides potassii TaxID=2911371 RepID=A0ABS9HHJ7_9ACTN|nr:pyridoxamine 5'-phosphate oxidase family protein [Nocardioides potassii]MCF6379598.1 pyridoxamine 5'-phosphate oxidase family protein [Nocardioides potassii]